MASKPIPKHHLKRLEYLGTYFRELRFVHGLTQKEVSEDINLSLNTILRIENSENYTLLTLFKLADYYEIDVHELFIDMNS
jgi:transcriptional regulator with XRE-family HTH domain